MIFYMLDEIFNCVYVAVQLWQPDEAHYHPRNLSWWLGEGSEDTLAVSHLCFQKMIQKIIVVTVIVGEIVIFFKICNFNEKYICFFIRDMNFYNRKWKCEKIWFIIIINIRNVIKRHFFLQRFNERRWNFNNIVTFFFFFFFFFFFL
jgi:hypothetical protein